MAPAIGRLRAETSGPPVPPSGPGTPTEMPVDSRTRAEATAPRTDADRYAVAYLDNFSRKNDRIAIERNNMRHLTQQALGIEPIKAGGLVFLGGDAAQVANLSIPEIAAFISMTSPAKKALKEGRVKPGDYERELQAQFDAMGEEKFRAALKLQSAGSNFAQTTGNDLVRGIPASLGNLSPSDRLAATRALIGDRVFDELLTSSGGASAAPSPAGVAQELYDTLQQEAAARAARIVELEAQAAQAPATQAPAVQITATPPPSRRAIIGGAAAGAGGLAAAMALADFLAQQGQPQPSHAAYSAQQAAAHQY